MSFTTNQRLQNGQATKWAIEDWGTFYGVISMECRPWKTVVDLFFTITFIFLRKTKNKTTGTAWHVTSFQWTILPKTIALDQSASEDSLSYCKKKKLCFVFAAVVGKWYKFVQMINAIPQWNFQIPSFASPHYFSKTWIGATNENSNVDLRD